MTGKAEQIAVNPLTVARVYPTGKPSWRSNFAGKEADSCMIHTIDGAPGVEVDGSFEGVLEALVRAQEEIE